jgi:oligoribonuclease (3'-5' exoribonuclease)
MRWIELSRTGINDVQVIVERKSVVVDAHPAALGRATSIGVSASIETSGI